MLWPGFDTISEILKDILFSGGFFRVFKGDF